MWGVGVGALLIYGKGYLVSLWASCEHVFRVMVSQGVRFHHNFWFPLGPKFGLVGTPASIHWKVNGALKRGGVGEKRSTYVINSKKSQILYLHRAKKYS